MRTIFLLSAALIACVGSACFQELSVDDSSDQTCTNNSDCPDGGTCDPESQTCRLPIVLACSSNADCLGGSICDPVSQTCVASTRPVVSLNLPPPDGTRSVDQVALSVDVFNSNPEANLDVFVQYSVLPEVDAEPVWYSISLAEGSIDLRGVSGSPNGESYAFVWDAFADAIANRGIDIARVDDDGSGLVTTVIVQSASVVLRAWTVSSDGTSQSELDTTDTLEIGNTPPRAQVVNTNGVGGAIGVDIQLEDAEGDACDLEVQFSAVDGIWRSAALTAGNTTGFACLANASLVTSVEWDSLVPIDDDATVPQGVGNQTIVAGSSVEPVRLRVRARDSATGSTHWGQWSAPFLVPQLINQTPPVILGLTASRAIQSQGNSPISIEYVLVDEQSDPIDITVEFSLDGGSTWILATEYPDTFSEGTQALLSAPFVVGGSGGVPHSFTWDPSTLGTFVPDVALVRLTAVDSGGTPAVATNALANAVGPSGISPNNSFLVEILRQSANNQGGGTACCVSDIATGDFDEDGLPDLALAKAADTSFSIVLNREEVTPWPESFFGAQATRLAVGDFGGSSSLDIVSINEDGSAALWIGDGAGAFAADDTWTVFDPLQIEVADFNADGRLDFLVVEMRDSPYRLAVYTNTGRASPRFTQSYLVNIDQTFNAAVADVNGDDTPDVVVSRQGNDDNGLFYLGQGNGEFELAGTTIETEGATRDYSTLVVGDLNLDAAPDVVTFGGGGGDCLGFGVDIELGTPNDGTQPSSFTSVETCIDGSFDFATGADVNGDGLMDLVGNAQFGELLVAFGTYDASSGAVGFTPTEVLNENTGEVIAVEDFNQDGTLDLAQYQVNANNLRVYLSNTTAFIGRTFLRNGAPLSARGVATLGQFDEDGVVDLMIATERDFSFRRGDGLPGRARGSFFDEERISWSEDSIYEPIAVFPNDLNADGILDLVVVGQSSGGSAQTAISWALGERRNGVGTGRLVDLTGEVVVGDFISSDPRRSRMADLNGDGFDDLLMLHTVDSVAGEYEFAVAFNTAGGPVPFSDVDYRLSLGPFNEGTLDVVDVNQDGQLDVVLALQECPGSSGDCIYVLLSDGGAVPVSNPFPSTYTYSLLQSPTAFLVRDVNWDGVVDLLRVQSGSFFISEGLSSGGDWTGFSPPAGADFILPAGGGGAFFSDVNLDSAIDVVWTSAGDGLGATVLPGIVRRGVPALSFGPRVDFDTELEFGNRTQASDINCDGVPDLSYQFGGLFRPNYLSREGFAPALTIQPRPLESGVDHPVRTVGVMESIAPYAWHPAVMIPCAESPDWVSALHAATSITLDTAWRPVTSPYYGGDTRHYVPVRVADTLRYQSVSRFGAPLDVSGGTRGLVLKMPLAPGLASDVDPRGLRVFRRWNQRGSAADYVQDELNGDANASSLLPRVLTSVGFVDVARAAPVWEELPRDSDDDASTGTGRRFVYDASTQSIQIVTDEGGFYVAIEMLP